MKRREWDRAGEMPDRLQVFRAEEWPPGSVPWIRTEVLRVQDDVAYARARWILARHEWARAHDVALPLSDWDALRGSVS